MNDIRFCDVLSKITWTRNSRDSDSDETLCKDELLKEEKMQDVDLGAEMDSFNLLRRTRKSLAKWKMATVVSITLLMSVSLSWAAKELRRGHKTIVSPILCESKSNP